MPTNKRLQPHWPAPAAILAGVTYRAGGCSEAPFNSNNFATHVGDDAADVMRNRKVLAEDLGIALEQFYFLDQVHGTEVVQLEACSANNTPAADAIVSRTKNQVCCILTADCLPVLLCNRAGTEVAAIHAGWRSLVAGIIEKTVAAMQSANDEIIAYFGPSIGATAFEVGDDVRDAFIAVQAEAEHCFVARENTGKYLADLPALAQLRLRRAGVAIASESAACSHSDSTRWFSYRRDGKTGRNLSFIVIRDEEA